MRFLLYSHSLSCTKILKKQKHTFLTNKKILCTECTIYLQIVLQIKLINNNFKNQLIPSEECKK